MAEQKVMRRLAAILAADIAGYSRLMGEDEAATVRDLKGHQAVVLPLIGEFGGRIIDTAGDGILAEFPSAVGAVECAVKLQRLMAERNQDVPERRRMQFRVGINLGDVIHDEARIYGDGINVAARLENLAEPGAICVSEDLYRQVQAKLSLTYRDLGEQQLKNIARLIRVFAVNTEAATDGAPAAKAPERPSIAVLPFASLSSDPEQAYFAEGLTASLTTDLSRISDLFVITSATAATFAGKTVDIRQVGRELGVRHVLQGSVHRSGDKVRINARLVDAATGAQLWSDRFDGVQTDLFALEDQITGRIAHSIGREMAAMAARDAERRKTNPQAADLLVRGIAMADKPQALENLLEQEVLFRGALALAPNNADAWARLARAILLQRLSFGSYLLPEHREEKLKEGCMAVEKALALDPNSARAHLAEGLLYQALGNPAENARSNEVAIALDRNLALAHANLGNALMHLGEPERAIPCIEQAMRLDPLGPQIGVMETFMGRAHFLQRHSDLAIAWLLKARASNPRRAVTHAFLSASYAQKGNDADARLALESLLHVAPNFKLSQTVSAPGPHYPEAYRKLYDEVVLPAFRRAGIPE